MQKLTAFAAVSIMFGVLGLASLFGQAHKDQPVSVPTALAPRYQIVVNPNVRADTFLLDTQTGMVWQREVIEELASEPHVWVREQRFDSSPELLEWASHQLLKHSGASTH